MYVIQIKLNISKSQFANFNMYIDTLSSEMKHFELLNT